MEITELMVGDWVSYLGFYNKIIYIGQKVSMYDGKGTEFTTDPEHIRPIPLTESILVKNGFVVESCGCVWYQEQGIKEQNYCVVYYRKNGEVRKVEIDFVNKVRAEYRDIYFVHQLQHELRRVGKDIEL